MLFSGNKASINRVAALALVILRVALSFTLAFGTTLWVQSRFATSALADDDPVEVVSDEDVDDPDPEPGSQSDPEPDPEPEPEPDPEPEPGPDPEPEPDPDPQPESLYVIDIGVFENGTTANAYAYASRYADTCNTVCAVIEQRGGWIDFDAAIEWSNEAWEYESSKVDWSMAPGDEAIARITPAGVLEAAGTEDGIVTVIATVDEEYTYEGESLSAVFLVELRGQTDTKYVTGIAICDDTGAVIDPSYRFEEGSLATAMLELQAQVSVYDPATDSTLVYQVTPYSGLAYQTDGEISDLLWESGDTRLGAVSDEGIYRPILEGTNFVYAYSNAGFNGQRITASATIDMPGEESGDYHPQDTLTVTVYYEDYPDQSTSKTYSISDLEALGTATYTYTALRGTVGFFTTTGRGPLLIKLLQDAGANTDSIARLKFGTPDNYQGVVSWSMLVDSDRYYFPNIDANSYAGKQQVPPIIAIESHRNVGTDTSPNYDMDSQRRFLLLFGAKDTGETTTNLQVYNIHTLYVEQEGAPPVQPGHDVWTVNYVDSVTGNTIESRKSSDPDNLRPPTAPHYDGYTFRGWNKDVNEATRTVTFTTVYEGDESRDGDGDNPTEDGDQSQDPDSSTNGDAEPTGENTEAPGDGTVNLVEAGAPGAQAVQATATGNTGQDTAQNSDRRPSVTQLSVDDVQVVTQGRWSMIQAINRHPANIEELMFSNPLAPYVAPTAAGVFFAGGLEALLGFRWQKRKPKLLA